MKACPFERTLESLKLYEASDRSSIEHLSLSTAFSEYPIIAPNESALLHTSSDSHTNHKEQMSSLGSSGLEGPS